MKFLMFNVVVIGALAYLAVGPGGAGFFKSDQAGPAPLAAKPPVSKPVVSKDEIADKAKEMYDRVYAKRMREAEKFFSMVEKEITEDETKIIAAADAKPVAPEIALAPAPEPVHCGAAKRRYRPMGAVAQLDTVYRWRRVAVSHNRQARKHFHNGSARWFQDSGNGRGVRGGLHD